ncbi:phosphatase PAP2 family protein [Ilumatobacter nonamiensis]|uniref:phosphatase PAP2 family protein n=1 Tax=Ilumatobacter nonamiensis TaxID=467093 RepID=UPI00130D59DB|nr:phosphatase PAP2 family protein [Ilumatobacter nonamiensis]
MTERVELPIGTATGRLVATGACLVGLVGSAAVAVRQPVPAWELRMTEWINDVPDAAATALYPIMQLGTLGGPLIVAAGILAFRRDRLLAAATVGAGFVAWFGAKGVKRLVARDRPGSYLPEILIREGDGSGLGFVSGHSAVAATAAVLAIAATPPGWRWVAAALAGLVGVARIVHGVHLPADVIGGWSFGILIGLGTLELVGLRSSAS